MAHEIEVYKAESMRSNNTVQDMHIIANKEPYFANSNVAYQAYKNDAENIFNAIMSCLPLCTTDQLLLLLLEYKANQFRIPYNEFKEENQNETQKSP